MDHLLTAHYNLEYNITGEKCNTTLIKWKNNFVPYYTWWWSTITLLQQPGHNFHHCLTFIPLLTVTPPGSTPALEKQHLAPHPRHLDPHSLCGLYWCCQSLCLTKVYCNNTTICPWLTAVISFWLTSRLCSALDPCLLRKLSQLCKIRIVYACSPRVSFVIDTTPTQAFRVVARPEANQEVMASYCVQQQVPLPHNLRWPSCLGLAASGTEHTSCRQCGIRHRCSHWHHKQRLSRIEGDVLN